MPHYPESWETGDTVGRNLAPYPKFTNADKGTWTTNSWMESLPGSVGGYGIVGFNGTSRLELPLTIADDAGRAVTIDVQYLTAADPLDPIEVHVTGKGAAKQTPQSAVPCPISTTLTWATGTAILPAGPFVNGSGAVLDPQPTTYEVVINSNSYDDAALGAIRLDFDGSPVVGYVDGDTEDSAEFSPAWDGNPDTPNHEFATSTVTALTAGGGGGGTVTADPVPPQQVALGVPYTLTLTATSSEGSPLSWVVNGGELPAGLELDPAGTIDGTPEAAGYSSVVLTVSDTTGAADQVGIDFEVTDPSAELSRLVDELAPMTAAFAGRPGDARAELQARAHLPIVVEFIKGYCRDRGWVGYVPPVPVRAVIVSAAARLLNNPEQVTSYQSADYSERPAVLNGYTLPEQGVLHNYRRRAA